MSDEETYEVVRTSADTAAADPVVLRQTQTTRLVFRPTLVNNAQDSDAPVQGTFVYQRKNPRGRWEDHNEVPLSSLRADEWVKLELHAGEVHQLVRHLGALYRLYHGEGLPKGKAQFLKLASEEPDGAIEPSDVRRLLGTIQRTGVDVALRVMEWLAEQRDAPAIVDQLGRLDVQDLCQINSLIGIGNLKALLRVWQENENNGDEEFWQQTFARYSFAITQAFAFPIMILRGKAYVGGKSLENTGGNIADFLAATHLTKNAVVVEIKTPNTLLLAKKEYRGGGIYAASDQFAGALSQVLTYRYALSGEFDSIGRGHRERIQPYNPHCLVVIGNGSQELSDDDRRRSFELTRRAVSHDVTVLTYDEVFGKVQALLDTLEGREKLDNGDVP